MLQAVFVHTIQDADHCREHGFDKEAILFSTDINVGYYCKNRLGLKCQDISSCIKPEEFKLIQPEATETCRDLLAELDRQVAPALNRRLDLAMRYFEPMYSLTAARQLSLYMLLRRCFEKTLAKHSFDSIMVYGGLLGPLQDTVEHFLSRLFPHARLRTVCYRRPADVDRTTISKLRLGDLRGLLPAGDNEVFFKPKFGNRPGAVENILVIEPFDKLSILSRETAKAGIYSFNPWTPAVGSGFKYEISRRELPEAEALEAIRSVPAERQDCLTLLYEAIGDDFCRNIVQRLQIIQAYRRITADAPVNEVYWEVPPFHGAAALLTEYCMTQAVQVIGVQSRATFFVGQTLTPYMPAALTNRCSKFLTRGATSEDIEALYPGITAKINVTPPCSAVASKTDTLVKGRRLADLAVYLTPALPFLQTGHISAQVTAQEALLTFLNEQQRKTIHLVTYTIPGDEYSWLLSALKRFKNITLIRDATQENYLAKYAPTMLFLDTLSPYLPDILREDVPVIVLEDRTVVFENKARELLAKAVYYTRELDEVKHLVKLHFSSELPAKKNKDYLQKFCNEPAIIETNGYSKTKGTHIV